MKIDDHDRVATEFGVAAEQVDRDHLISYRRASRDLWDLWALSAIGAIDSTAGTLYRRHGPTNRLPPPQLFDRAPDQDDWSAQLGGQTRLTVSAATALHIVRDAWARVSE